MTRLFEILKLNAADIDLINLNEFTEEDYDEGARRITRNFHDKIDNSMLLSRAL